MSKEDSDDEYYTAMLGKKKRYDLRKKLIDDYDFVSAWQESKSTHEIAETLSVSRADVLRRGRRLRFNGVPLRRFPLEEVDEDLG